MEYFEFSPESQVPETLTRETSNTVTMNGWLFSARPTSTMQRRFRVRLHGLKWYLNTDDTYDATEDEQHNARALELFYEDHEMWNPFIWDHPHLGQIVVRFASPVSVPASPPGGDGLLEALEITLVEAGLPVPPPQELVALWFDYETGEYWADGASAASLSAVPGYSFTRTGTQEALAVDNTMDSFTANVPAINDKGFHVYGALTNNVVRSSELDNASWTKTEATITANAGTGPSGATLDKIIPTTAASRHGILQPHSLVGTLTVTISAVVKADGFNYCALGLSNSSGNWSVRQINLTTGAEVGSGYTAGAMPNPTAIYSVDLGGGLWRVVVTYVATGITSLPRVALLVSSGGNPIHENVAGNAVNGILAGHLQIIEGNFPDGGPFISTAGATASLGPSALAVTVPDGDYNGTYTFDDDSEQIIPVTIADGSFEHPVAGTLNRGIIKQFILEAV